jgi:hypothetical protein
MWFQHLRQRFFGKPSTSRRPETAQKRARAGRKLQVESLEERQLLSTFNVANGDVWGPNGLVNAILLANNDSGPDTINLATNGSYTLTGAATQDSLGFNGLPPIGPGTSAAHTLTIEGNGATILRSGVKGTPAFRLLFVDTGATVTIQDLVLENGVSTFGGGGAIRNLGGNVTLINDHIDFCSNDKSVTGGPTYGGGILSDYGSLTMQGVIMDGNQAIAGSGNAAGSAHGGALFSDNSTVTISNCQFVDNHAIGGASSKDVIGGPIGAQSKGGDGQGGAIYIDNSIAGSFAMSNSTVTWNFATGGQGGNGVNGSDGSTPGVTVKDNGTAGGNGAAGTPGDPGGAAEGAGVFVQAGNATFTTVQILNNLAQGGAGGVGGNGGSGATGGGSVFYVGGTGGNGAAGLYGGDGGFAGGGGLYNAQGAITLWQTILSSNTARGGVGGAGGNGGNGGNGGAGLGGGNGGLPYFAGWGGNGGNAQGGGVYSSGTLNCTDSAIAQNLLAPGVGGRGGAGGNGGSAGTSTFLSVRFADGAPGRPGGMGGSAQGGGAYVSQATGVCNFVNSTLAANLALGAAGGAGGAGGAAGNDSQGNYGTPGQPGLAGSDGPGQGGGLYAAAGIFLLASDTIATNAATNDAAGLCYAGAQPFYLNNVLVAQNVAPTNREVEGNFVSFGGNLIAIRTGFAGTPAATDLLGTASLPINPRLGTLCNYGGGTLTINLLPGSPAIDAGIIGLSFGANNQYLPTDQRGAGFARITNGSVDIGAYEYQPHLVTNTQDSGPGSLRQAISDGSDAAPIVFDPSLAHQTIHLTSGELLLSQNVTISGSAAPGLTISNSAGRAFNVAISATAALTDLTINSCQASLGAGVYNAGNLTLSNCTLSNNQAANGGALYQISGWVNVINCTIYGNHAKTGTGKGGGVNIATGTLFLRNTTFAQNTSVQGGGLYVSPYAIADIGNTLMAGDATASGAGDEVSGHVISRGHNLVARTDRYSNGWRTSDITGSLSNPVIANVGLLQQNGGATATVAIKGNSPAVDAGDNSLAVDASGYALATDQRGRPRIDVDGTVDIGAFELVHQIILGPPPAPMGPGASGAQNPPPAAQVSGPANGVPGQPLAFLLTATDSLSTALAAGFTYTVDWGDGSPVDTRSATPNNGAGGPVCHNYYQRGAFPIQVTATDFTGVSSLAAVTGVTIGPVGLQADPVDPTKTALVLGTDLGGTNVVRCRADAQCGIKVLVNGVILGTFHPTGHIIVFANGASDDVEVGGNVHVPSILLGGTGDVTLRGGGGVNIIVGGSGINTLIGGGRANLIIGGSGRSSSQSLGGNDLDIAGFTSFDQNIAALTAILAEWTSADNYATRVATVMGQGDRKGHGLNGSYFLQPGRTVFDNDLVDALTAGPGLDLIFAHTAGSSPPDQLTELIAADRVIPI